MIKNKKGIIFGIANDHSIAWGIAKKLHENGAKLAITYQNETLFKRVKPLADKVDSELLLECDFSKNNALETTFNEVSNKWQNLDFVIHAAAYSDKKELNGRYIDAGEENFIKSLNISCFSFTKIAKLTKPLMNGGGSLLTLSFYGSTKVMPNYNVMGIAKSALEASIKYLAKDLGKRKIRVNALSPGPIKTLAASAIGGFNYILKWNENNSPLKRNITVDDISGSTIYFLSDLSSGVTGEIHHVDSGYNIIGMKDADSPDIFEKK